MERNMYGFAQLVVFIGNGNGRLCSVVDRG